MSASHSESSQSVSASSNIAEEIIDQPYRKRRRSEGIWYHFNEIGGLNGVVQAQCRYCRKLISCNSNLREHLKNACPKYAEIYGNPIAHHKFCQSVSRRNLAMACIKHNLPFNIGEYGYFELFLKSVNPAFKLPCRDTMINDVTDIHEEEKHNVWDLLSCLKSRVSLTTNIWTSEQSCTAYYSLTAHFVDYNWELQKKFLSLKRLRYPYDGDDLFDIFKEIILEEWPLDTKLFSVVVDNASLNNDMITQLTDWVVEDSLIPFSVDLLHVRCFAHILNLMVQDGLNEIRGLLEKIRETVRYLNKSRSANLNFQWALSQCNLLGLRQMTMDLPNRWNSTYDLLDTALPLQEAFCRLQEIDEDYHLSPSSLEWEIATMVHGCLRSFYEASRHFSGSKYPTSNVFFPNICDIHLKLIKWKCSEQDYVRKMACAMKEKFDKYWDECYLILAIAVVFDPRYKLYLVEYFFTKIYGSEECGTRVGRIRATLFDLFIAYGGSSISSLINPVLSNASGNTPGVLEDFEQWCNESKATPYLKSELDTYLDERKFPRTDNFNILGWWKTNGPRFPTLATIARDILAVPVTTVVSEASFNVGGRIIDESYSSLDPGVVEALVVANDWFGTLPEKMQVHR